MTDELAPYSWVDRMPWTWYDDALRQQVEGYRVRAIWTKTGTLLTLYVPTAKYTPDQVDALVKAAGAKDDAIEGLAAPPAT